MCTCRHVCRRCPAVSTAMMSSIPARSALIWAARPAWSDFVRAARELRAANPARYRAESHVRLAPQPVVGRRAEARAVQPFADFFDIRNPPRSALLRAFVLARKTLWRGLGSRRAAASKSSARNRASSTMRIPGRWRRHPGACCWQRTRSAASTSSIVCAVSRRPGEEDQCAYQPPCGAGARGSRRGGRSPDGCKRPLLGVQGDKARVDAILRRQYYLLHGWKLAGELTNYRRFFDIDYADWDSRGAP